VVLGSRRSELQRPELHTGADSQYGVNYPQGGFGQEGALPLRETIAKIDATQGGPDAPRHSLILDQKRWSVGVSVHVEGCNGEDTAGSFASCFVRR
jgi:hypothetical protein